MTHETMRWLGLMFAALLANEAKPARFARFMDTAIATSGSNNGHGIDWVEFGSMMRAHLGWDNYPSSP